MQPSDTPSPSNRRSARRQKPRSTIKLECRRGAYGLGPNLAVRCLDVSESGASIVVKEVFKVGQEIELQITGYGMAKPIKRLAHVRWAVALADGQYGLGLRFQSVVPYRDLQALVLP